MYVDVKLVLCDVCLITLVLPITCFIVLTNDGKNCSHLLQFTFQMKYFETGIKNEHEFIQVIKTRNWDKELVDRSYFRPFQVLWSELLKIEIKITQSSDHYTKTLLFITVCGATTTLPYNEMELKCPISFQWIKMDR